MPNWSKPDTLVRAAAKKVGLIDLLGEDFKFDIDINIRSPYGGHKDLIRLGITKKF